MPVLELTADTFDEAVAASPVPVLVDFTAEWCPPCKVMAPVLEALAAEAAGRLAIARVDVDVNRALTQRFAVFSMPTFVLFVDGRERRRMVGARPRRRLEREVAEALFGTAVGASRPWPSPVPTSSSTPPSPTPSAPSSGTPSA